MICLVYLLRVRFGGICDKRTIVTPNCGTFSEWEINQKKGGVIRFVLVIHSSQLINLHRIYSLLSVH